MDFLRKGNYRIGALCLMLALAGAGGGAARAHGGGGTPGTTDGTDYEPVPCGFDEAVDPCATPDPEIPAVPIPVWATPEAGVITDLPDTGSGSTAHPGA